MMKHRAVSGAVLSVGLACGLFAACAGETTPEVDDDLRGNLESVYSGEAPDGAGGRAPVGSVNDDDDDDDGASAGRGGSASASAAGAAGAGDDGNEGGAAGSAMAAAGAGGAVGAAGAGGGSLAACDGFPIIQANCGGGSCHGQGSNLGTFAVSEEEFRSYIGEEGVVCAGSGVLVDPADPEGSVLVQKLSDEPPCGQPMPAGPDRLAPADIECIAAWMGSL